MQRIYIAKEDGVTRWANFMLPQDPPAVTTKLVAARIIQPDGSSTVYNPAKMPAASDCSSGMCGALMMVFMPDAHAGCVIEIAYRTQHILDASEPDFTEELPVQQDIPVLQTELQLQIPDKMGLHFKLRNSDQKPSDTLVDGVRTLSWKLGAMAAYEALPYDPPERDFVTALDISSLDSWDAFATWYRRLTRGSDEQDDAVKAKAQELAAGATSRIDKIRKAYEFVSALRYVAIEFGINGIRPRTPAIVLQNRYGDCKDKANLLVALLADMGIDGRFCLLNRGSSTDVSFPSWQFNHAIAYVPKAPQDGQPDDLWLDTTDSTAPFPTLSPGDIGRSALVFNPDSAKFLNVAVTGKDVTDLQEHWKLQEKSDGSWTGTLQSTWSGLAEYDIRSSVRGQTPLQRDFILQTTLNRQLESADFTGLNLTPADDLSVPLRLDAQVDVQADAPTAPSPRPGFAVETFFAPPTRDRPLLLNNGQKLHLTQTLELVYQHGDPAEVPAPFDETAGGLHAKTTWERVGDHTWHRTAELDVDEPLVAQANYVAVRHMLRNWLDHLTP
jgi:transglutaminase-like putative cysteine protease